MKGLFLLLTLFFPSFGFSNEAANIVAEKLFSESTHSILAKQWKEAAWNLRIALFLDPKLQVAQNRLMQLPWRQDFSKRRVAFPPVVTKREGWQQNKMEEVNQFLEINDVAQAKASVLEILYLDPNNERAKTLLSKLERTKETQNDATMVSRFEEAKGLWEAGNQAKETGDWLKAYQHWRRIDSLFQKEDLKPTFYNVLQEELKKVSELLVDQFNAKLAKWEKELTNSERLSIVGKELCEAISQYPPNPKAQELLEKIYETLQKKVEPLLMQAKTLYELEGCSSSVDKFRTIQKLSVFSKIPAWQEANHYLQTCTAFH